MLSGPAEAAMAGDDTARDVVFNFDNADLEEVIRTIADILQINYIADTAIKGAVTIHTAGRLRKEELFDVFFQILEANALTAVREGGLYRITRLKDATRIPMAARFGWADTDLKAGDRVIMQIIPLDYISTAEMIKLLTPFVSSEGTIISHDGSNTLLASINPAAVLVRIQPRGSPAVVIQPEQTEPAMIFG